MVNAEKHRRKAVENEFKDFIEVINGTAKKNLYKKSTELDFKTKPKLASDMNMNHFRPQLKKEIELKQKIF